MAERVTEAINTRRCTRGVGSTTYSSGWIVKVTTMLRMWDGKPGTVPSETPAKGILQLGKRSRPDKEKQDPHTSHCCENSTFTSGLIGRDVFAYQELTALQGRTASATGCSCPSLCVWGSAWPLRRREACTAPEPLRAASPSTPSCTHSPAEHKALLSFCQRSFCLEGWWSSPTPSHQPSPTQTHQIPGSCCPCQHPGGRGPPLCDRSWLPGAAGCVS